MVLTIISYPCNISGFVTSGSKFDSHSRKFNLRKKLNISQISLEVDETLQLYLACLNKQKSQRWPTSKCYRFSDSSIKFLQLGLRRAKKKKKKKNSQCLRFDPGALPATVQHTNHYTKPSTMIWSDNHHKLFLTIVSTCILKAQWWKKDL